MLEDRIRCGGNSDKYILLPIGMGQEITNLFSSTVAMIGADKSVHYNLPSNFCLLEERKE